MFWCSCLSIIAELLLVIGVCCLCVGGPINDEPSALCRPWHCAAAPYGCRTYVTKDDRSCPTGCDYTCGAPWCGLRPCSRPCIHGYIQDAVGCNTCTCKDICRNQLCDRPCPSGYLLDGHGCSLCDCQLQFPSCLAVLKCYQGLCPYSCKCQSDCFDAFPLPDNLVVFAF